jgi:hypothetical protein
MTMARTFRWIYFVWFAIIAAAIVLQLYLAGYGVFAFKGVDPFGPHFLVGDLIGIAILISVALAFAARVPRRITQINAGLLVLYIVQFFLAHTGVQALSALHIVNGVLILGVTGYLTRLARQQVSEMPAGTSGTPAMNR